MLHVNWLPKKFIQTMRLAIKIDYNEEVKAFEHVESIFTILVRAH